jgi:isoquinoline 1-oxidoreductase
MRRREFFQILGTTGLLLVFPANPLAAQEDHGPGRPSFPKDFNAYLRIGEDGRVGCFVGKVEMGQGSMTVLAMLLAEELDVALDSVDVLMGDTELCPWDMGTWGSLTVRQFGPVLRGAAAEARSVLLDLAAEKLQVPKGHLQVRDGVVHAEGGAGVTYASLVQGRRIERHLEKVPLKTTREFRIVGRKAPRKDALAKVTGAALYAADMKVPGTLHARILRPPAHGAKLKDLDVHGAEAMPGVRVIRDGDLVAVLHARPDLAQAALEKVRATWTPSGNPLAEGGDLAAGEKRASFVLEESYFNAYVAHAAIETHTALAAFDKGKATIWASTQAPFTLKTQIVQTLGLPARDVRVIAPYLGGGFGGKGVGYQAIEAARLAKVAGCPVQVVWDRREEFFLDTFRPAAVVKLRSGADREGRITFWDFLVVAAGDREAGQFYDIPDHRTRSRAGGPADLHPFATGAWRAPAVNTNTFARECQIDAMAARLKMDPVAFRLKNLKDPRMVRVLEKGAEAFGWIPGAAPRGRGWGVACAKDSDSYVAAFAEVAVDRATGAVKVRRVALAQDMGLVVNPDGALQQIEGGVFMGLGYALTEEVRFRGGVILNPDFDGYRLPRFSDLPEIRAVLVDNPDAPATGCGEPPIITIGALMANAVFDAVGARVRRLPLTPARILAALAGA